MVWNVELQFAALILVLIVVMVSFGQKRLNFAAERSFARLLIIILASIILDILTVFAIYYKAELGATATNFVCKAYLLSLTAIGCQASWFAVAEIRHSFRKFWVNITVAPVVVEIIFLSLRPVYYYKNNNSISIYGPCIYITYVLCLLYTVAILVMLFMLRNEISTKMRVTIAVSMFVILGASVIQFFLKDVFIMSFALALSCSYLFMKLENPEYHLDFATNVFNREGFKLIISENITFKEAKSLVVFRITDYSQINEIFGARAMEKLIIEIANYADELPGSTLFRIDDSMFVLSFDYKDNADSAVDKLLKRFRQPWKVGGVLIEINTSIAFIESTMAFNDYDSLEEAIYFFNKESVKLGPMKVFEVDENEIKKRQHNIEITRAIDWAFKNDTVEVYYQPIYDIKAGKFTVLEALVRIRDENGTLILPGDFIEFAEKNGMILRIGEIVFRKICEFVQRMHVQEYGIERIEVNLSVVQCIKEDVASVLKNIMGEYQVPGYLIDLEITESSASHTERVLLNTMKELKDYGCNFVLDDYGSGYSNLTNIIKLPVDVVKIDRSFVRAFFENKKVRIAAEGTIEVIHELGLKVVVEGVETEEEYLMFKNFGVEYIQGYYFSRPLPKDKVLNFIQEWM